MKPAPPPAKTRRAIDLHHAALCDEELVARAVSGDTRAFAVLMARHGTKVYRLALRILANPCDAEEATQDAFLSAHRSLASFNGKAKFTTWLHRIGVNAALMRRRAVGRRPAIFLEDVPGLATEEHASWVCDDRLAPSADDVAQQRELGRELSQAILALDTRYAPIFVLRELDGLSTREAANKLGLSAPLARLRLHRARAALRSLVKAPAPRAVRATKRAA